MAVSFYMVVSLFIVFALVDVVVLSTRALLSGQHYSMTTLYVMMAVHEAMIMFEMLAALVLLLSTALVTAGMWGDIASLFSFFLPLWLLRAFFAAFTMVYKNVLIPRWTAAARAEINAGVFTHSVRAWHRAGYGAVVALDVVCCCVYFLTAVYVFGYLSDKTLYVPYHRRRWRHEQLERVSVAAAARSDPKARRKATDAATQQQQEFKQQRKRGRDSSTSVDGDCKDGKSEAYPVATLARTPSFAQWQNHGPQVASTSLGAQSSLTNSSTAVGSKDEGSAEQRSGNRTVVGNRLSALPTFPSISFTVAGAEQEDLSRALGLSHTADARATADGDDHRPSTTAGGATSHGNEGRLKMKHTSVYNARTDAASRNKTASDPTLMPSRQRQTTALVSALPPLRLPRRFTLNMEGEDGRLNQYAAALVEHGFSARSHERTKSAPAEISPSIESTVNNSGTQIQSTKKATMKGEGGSSLSANAAASLRDGLVDTTSPKSISQSSSTPKAAGSAARVVGGAHLSRTASEPILRASYGAVKSTSGGHSSFRRMLSAWSGFKAKPASSSSSGATGAQQQQQQQQRSSSFASSNSCRQYSGSQAPSLPNPPPQNSTSSSLQCALDGSGSGHPRDGHPMPPLPPCPRRSFCIDQATGNVVAMPPKSV
ncbi:hypothetical protein ABL78_1453 [Leptomonas seymouri]|uniref:Transmembrane protein n=1 Tax=Leptomonas seymouri TaxID=5684 RepID=A0A0N0P8E2_LEPSE|nr:hypothetical protein ABL78_1453 [Leptomonas seymouri]|eukprot:KPI89417.1 hypothetical protein ABL78_1453 [Leptomonas seymouri]